MSGERVSETFKPFPAPTPTVRRMRLGYVIHYVDDPAATVAFYEAAFGLERGFVHESGQFAEMDSGSTKLAFTSHALGAEAVPVPYVRSRPDADPAGYELTLLCGDVPAAYARAVGAGAASVAEPHDTAWGQTVAYVRDRDGALVGLATPIG
jgi:uncharacterized glyoxalase superfamily protein PhnB